MTDIRHTWFDSLQRYSAKHELKFDTGIDQWLL